MKHILILILLLAGIYHADTASAQLLVHNVKADVIITPPIGAYVPSQKCPIEIQFSNNGLENEDSVKVILIATSNFSFFSDTVIIPHLYSGDSVVVKFNTDKLQFLYKNKILGIALLNGDQKRSDDTVSRTVNISYEKDIRPVSILSPQNDALYPLNSNIQLSAIFQWVGNFTISKTNVKTRVKIQKWPDRNLVFQADTIIPLISFYENNVEVTFPVKQGIFDTKRIEKGAYRVAMISLLPDDGDRTNDTAYNYITIANKISESDILIDSLYSPRNNTHFDTNEVPIKIRLRNDGTSKGLNKTFITTVKTSTDSVIYRDTIFIPVLGMRSILDTQFANLVISRKWPYYPQYKLEVAATPPNEDQSWRDTVRSVFTIGEPSKVKLIDIRYPAQGDTIKAGTVIKPQVLLRALWGNDFKKYHLKVKIENLNNYVYHNYIDSYWPIYVCDTAMPDITTDSYPHQFTFPVPRSNEFGVDSISRALSGNHRLTCYIFSDSNQVQDSLSIVFYVSGSTLAPYITIDSIIYPGKGDTIKQTKQYSQLLIRNSGPIDVPDIVVHTVVSASNGGNTFNFRDTITILSRDSMILQQGPFYPTYLGQYAIETSVSCDTLPRGLYYPRFGINHSFIVVKKTASTTFSPGNIKNSIFLDLPHPNPFSATTTLSYKVASGGYVTMRILDVAGVTMETVMSDMFVSEGKHEVTLDGSHLPSGTYFVEMLFKDSEGMLAREIQPMTVRK